MENILESSRKTCLESSRKTCLESSWKTFFQLPDFFNQS